MTSLENSSSCEFSANLSTSSLAPSPFADKYKMNHPRRGTAIIFNHVNFSIPEYNSRDGSDQDRDDLEKVFRELGFDVFAHNDLTAREIKGVLITVSRKDHSDSDCFVVVVLSHGDNGKLYAKDEEYPTSTIWEYFNARNCPTLAGKPKLFFIQACRGSNEDTGQRLWYTDGVQTDKLSADCAYYTIPVMADILVMYSTVEGFSSWRTLGIGSYFIQSLVRQLRNHHATKDLLSILTYVNREVAICPYGEPEMSGHKQMCSIVSMLTRLLYFDGNL